MTLGSGLSVQGHHGTAPECGRYELVLNVRDERVDCAACGATDVVKDPFRKTQEGNDG